MLRRVEIVSGPVEEHLRSLPEPWSRLAGDLPGSVGAWVEFHGIVRDRETVEGREIVIEALDYEAHPPMAIHQMERILDQLAAKRTVSAVLVVHRVGRIHVGETSILVRVLAPHRGEAFEVCASFMDELKRWVPIWKHPVPGRSK